MAAGPIHMGCEDSTTQFDTVLQCVEYREQPSKQNVFRTYYARAVEPVLVLTKFDTTLCQLRQGVIDAVEPLPDDEFVVLRYLEGTDYAIAKKTIDINMDDHDRELASLCEDSSLAFLTQDTLQKIFDGLGFLVAVVRKMKTTQFVLDASSDQYNDGEVLSIVLYWLHGGAPPARGYFKGTYALAVPMYGRQLNPELCRDILAEFARRHITSHEPKRLFYADAGEGKYRDAPDRVPTGTTSVTKANILQALRGRGFVGATLDYFGEDIGVFVVQDASTDVRNRVLTEPQHADIQRFDIGLIPNISHMWMPDVLQTAGFMIVSHGVLGTEFRGGILDEFIAETVCELDERNTTYQHDLKFKPSSCVLDKTLWGVVCCLLRTDPKNIEWTVRYTRPSTRDGSAGAWIPFHTDVAQRTVQIPLTSDEDEGIEGGRLVFHSQLTDSFIWVPRVRGTAIMHEGWAEHGVTRHTKGTRIGLFATVKEGVGLGG